MLKYTHVLTILVVFIQAGCVMGPVTVRRVVMSMAAWVTHRQKDSLGTSVDFLGTGARFQPDPIKSLDFAYHTMITL